MPLGVSESELVMRSNKGIAVRNSCVGMIVAVGVSAAFAQDSNIPEKREFELRINHSQINLGLLAGTFSSRMEGTIRLFIGAIGVTDPQVPPLVAVRVIQANLVGPSLPNTVPGTFVLDPGQASTGAFDPATQEIRFALHLIAADGSLLPVPMPVNLQGKLNGEYLHVSGTNGDVPDGTMRLVLGAIRRELLFSTEVGFTSGALGVSISAGDLLSEAGQIVARNAQLTRNLGFEPVAPDVGLDGVYQKGIGDRHFTTEVSEPSTTLTGISDGDLVAESGSVVRTNAELIDAFGPMPVIPAVGLDAHHTLRNGLVLFSIEDPFFSENLGTVIREGDLLSETGAVLLNNFQLLTLFAPLDPSVNHGLDAMFYPEPRLSTALNREIWFSTEVGFLDLLLGPIGDGDLLSTGGFIVRGNLDLVEAFAPVEDLDNFGLDAVHVRRVIAGDTTSDNHVNLVDFATFARCFGSSNGVPPSYSCLPVEFLACDLDGDGGVNLVDFATLALNFDG